MHKYFKDTKLDSSFFLSTNSDIYRELPKADEHMKMIWNRGQHEITVQIDGILVEVSPNQILCATYLQKARIYEEVSLADVVLLSFNQPFYCIHTNDGEVSCGGLLFFGSNYTPIITLPEDDIQRLKILINVLEDEFSTIDNNQEEMLRLLLKRMIIICTRLGRKQLIKNETDSKEIDILRTYNVLVEEHFKEKKQVSDYAALIFKSPKTIANTFHKLSDKTPLEIIHDRIILEAKRLLIYTDKSSKEIAMELGFDDPAQFSRFFKKYAGKTSSEFKASFKNQMIS